MTDIQPFPEIVCICGSTRFIDEWNYWRQKLTYEGKIVLAIEIVTSQDIATDPQHADPGMKAKLDELHKRKIDLSDRIFVLNVSGYIGESTRSEIEYTRRLGKPIDYLEPHSAQFLHEGGHFNGTKSNNQAQAAKNSQYRRA